MPRIPFDESQPSAGSVNAPNVYTAQGGIGLHALGEGLTELGRVLTISTAKSEAHKAYFDLRTTLIPRVADLAKVSTDPEQFRRAYTSVFQTAHDAQAKVLSAPAREVFSTLSYDFGIEAFNAGFHQVNQNAVTTAKANMTTALDGYRSEIAAGGDPFKIWPKALDLMQSMVPVLGIAEVQAEMHTRAEQMMLDAAVTSPRQPGVTSIEGETGTNAGHPGGLRLTTNPLVFFEELQRGNVRVPNVRDMAAVLRGERPETPSMRVPTEDERKKLEATVATTMSHQHAAESAKRIEAEALRRTREDGAMQLAVRGIVAGKTNAYQAAVDLNTLGNNEEKLNNFWRSWRDNMLTSPTNDNASAEAAIRRLIRMGTFPDENELVASALFKQLSHNQAKSIVTAFENHVERQHSDDYRTWSSSMTNAEGHLKTRFAISDMFGDSGLKRLGSDVISDLQSTAEAAFAASNQSWKRLPEKLRPSTIANDLIVKYEKQFEQMMGLQAEQIAGRFAVLQQTYGVLSAEGIDKSSTIPTDQKELYKAVLLRHLREEEARATATPPKPPPSLKDRVLELLKTLNLTK